MNAKYYRFLYYPVNHGTLFGASIGAANGKDGTQILYISSVEGIKTGSGHAPLREEHLHYLVLADVSEETIGRAQALADANQVDVVLLPKTDRAHALTLQEGTVLREVEHTEEICLPDFVMKLFCSEGRLAAYVGSAGMDPVDTECVMNVKAHNAGDCNLTVDAGNLSCEMKCLLCQDVTYCKRQNQKNDGYFVDGHLLPGTADMAKCLPQLKTYLAEEWKKIRFAGLPEEEKAWNEDLLTAGTPGHRRYFIGAKDTSAEIIRAAAVHDAYSSFALTDAKAGLCISGCYAKR